MKDRGIGWAVQTNPYESSSIKYKKRESEITYSGFRVRLCTKCGRAHECSYYAGEGNSISYYEDFPTYGLRRETCRSCGEL